MFNMCGYLKGKCVMGKIVKFLAPVTHAGKSHRSDQAEYEDRNELPEDLQIIVMYAGLHLPNPHRQPGLYSAVRRLRRIIIEHSTEITAPIRG